MPTTKPAGTLIGLTGLRVPAQAGQHITEPLIECGIVRIERCGALTRLERRGSLELRTLNSGKTLGSGASLRKSIWPGGFLLEAFRHVQLLEKFLTVWIIPHSLLVHNDGVLIEKFFLQLATEAEDIR